MSTLTVVNDLQHILHREKIGIVPPAVAQNNSDYAISQIIGNMSIPAQMFLSYPKSRYVMWALDILLLLWGIYSSIRQDPNLIALIAAIFMGGYIIAKQREAGQINPNEFAITSGLTASLPDHVLDKCRRLKHDYPHVELRVVCYGERLKPHGVMGALYASYACQQFCIDFWLDPIKVDAQVT